MSTAFALLSVFTDGSDGGNAVPVVVEADDLSNAQMQALARDTGLESAFLLRADASDFTGRLRYWVPNHEMSMCGHATVGTAWLLHRLGREQPAQGYRFDTASGPVRAGADDQSGWFEQSLTDVDLVSAEHALPALEALGLVAGDVAGSIRNAAAPRVKTLIPLHNTAALNALDPDPDAVQAACEAIGSTGLYPFVLNEPAVADARQFPRSSGYREDPATGIAAAALFFGLRGGGSLVGPALEVRQGHAMGRPSRILVEMKSGIRDVDTCRVSGTVVRVAP